MVISGVFPADGTEIVYTARVGGIQQLYRVPLNGGTSEQITNFDENDTCWNISNPQCCPDGRTNSIFLLKYNGVFDTSGFYANADGTKRKVNYTGLCSMNLVTGEIEKNVTRYRLYSRWYSPDISRLLENTGWCRKICENK